MARRFDLYRLPGATLPRTNWGWNMVGAGVENIGLQGIPLHPGCTANAFLIKSNANEASKLVGSLVGQVCVLKARQATKS